MCTSHTHTKIRRKKCGDLGLKPGGVMWGLYEISLFEKTLVSTSHTHTQIRRKKWGPNSSKQVPSTTVQFSHTHYLGPQIAPLTNTNDLGVSSMTKVSHIDSTLVPRMDH